MIVKDEENWIRQCLESVKSLVSEMIVVDTGSTDRTIEIARECGAKIFNFSWCNDFAAARNFSLQQANGDWILVLDADEVIAPRDLPEFEKLVADRTICTEFMQRHYTDDHRLSDFTPIAGEFPEYEKGQLGYFESNCARLFPNHEKLEFRGKVHELVEHSINEAKRFTIRRANARLHHFGHTTAVKQRKNKTSLYRPLGEEKTKLAPHDWKNFFELGIENNCNGRYPEAAKALVRSLELNPNYLDTWVNLGYVFLQMEHYAQGIEALRHALKLNPQSAEAYCNLGVIYMRMKDLPKAEAALSRAVAINPKYVNAFCNLGQTLAHQGRFAEAAFVYKRTLEISPHCVTALSDLGALYLHAEVFDESARLLQQAVALEGAGGRANQILAQLKRVSLVTLQSIELLHQVSSTGLKEESSKPSSEACSDKPSL